MRARQIQIRGCLPTLVALVFVAAVLATVMTAGLAFLAVAVGAGLLAALVRWVRGLAGSRDATTSAAQRRAADVTIEAEVIEPAEGDEGRPPRQLE